MKKYFVVIYILFLLFGIIYTKPQKDVNLAKSNCKISLENLLGCNKLGKDILALNIYGSLNAILFSIPARILTLTILMFTILSVYTLGNFCLIIMDSISSVFLSIPSFLLGLIILFTFGKSIFIFFVAIFLMDWANAYQTYIAKLNEVKSSNYVKASLILGGSKFFIFKKHILLELLSISKILFLTGIPSVIMTLSILSFLGIDFGTDYFGEGLGEQISFSKDYFYSSPFSLLSPILGILFLVLIFSL